MKTDFLKTGGRVSGAICGFTLVEMMVTVTLFSFVALAIIGLQIYGMRVYTLGATMLSATSNGRQTMNSLRDNIRAGKIVLVGNCYGTNGVTFVGAPIGSLQEGNALEIQYTNLADTNNLVFYMDGANNQLVSFSNSTATGYANSTNTVIANYVTNTTCFFAEDYLGIVQTNYINSLVIHVQLQFYQWQFPIGIIGGNAANSFNYYSLNTRINRRDND